jgi:hypothetical protein
MRSKTAHMLARAVVFSGGHEAVRCDNAKGVVNRRAPQGPKLLLIGPSITCWRTSAGGMRHLLLPSCGCLCTTAC